MKMGEEWMELGPRKKHSYSSDKELASNLDHLHVFTTCTDLPCILKTSFVPLSLVYSCIICSDIWTVQFIQPWCWWWMWTHQSRYTDKNIDKIVIYELTDSEILYNPSKCKAEAERSSRKESIVPTGILGTDKGAQDACSCCSSHRCACQAVIGRMSCRIQLVAD